VSKTEVTPILRLKWATTLYPFRIASFSAAARQRGEAPPGRAAGGSLMPRVLDLHVAPALCVPVEFAMLNP
jgi:hypothetical protein